MKIINNDESNNTVNMVAMRILIIGKYTTNSKMNCVRYTGCGAKGIRINDMSSGINIKGIIPRKSAIGG